MSHLLSVSIFIALLGQGATARADQEPVYLDYTASEGCPGRLQFEEQVRARTALARFVDVRGTGRFFTLYAGVHEGLAVGRVTSGRGDEAGSAREVSSTRCDAVVAALALIVALAIDPHASTAPSLPPATTVPLESATVPEVAKPAVQLPPVVGHAAMPPPVVTADGTARSDLRPREAPYWVQRSPIFERSKPQTVALLLGVRSGGSLWFGSTSVPLAAAAAAIELESLQARRVSPAVRLSAEQSVSETVHPSDGGGARFALTMARVDLCPWRIELASGVALRPCAGFEGGRLTGNGIESGPVVHQQTSHRPWWAVEESARVQFQLGSGWRVEFEASLQELLWRDRFVFQMPGPGASVPIINVPLLVPRVGLGLALRFW